jgi:acetyl esterase/lipase
MFMRYISFVYVILLSLFGMSCVSRHKNIVYSKQHDLKLDVYSARKVDKSKPVLVFIHGGNWVRGDKSIYKFFGRGFAKKGIVTVIINYRLSQKATYDSLAINSAMAVKWVKENISSYKGDTNNIFVSGHSAGAHLAALIATDDSYFNDLQVKNPIRGTILIDAFGLDMYNYLTTNKSDYSKRYYSLFSEDQKTWKKASPVFHLKKGMPPFLMFVGTKTVPVIMKGSTEFLKALQPYQPGAPFIIVKGKTHTGMIFQFLNKHKKAYSDIMNFINSESKKL